MSRKFFLAAAVAAALATTTLPSVPAFATNSAAPIPGVTDSSKLSTPVVVSGTVAGADGKPASGAPVVIRVWPDSETLGRLPIGSAVATENVAAAVTDSSGAFALRIDPSKSLSKFADPNGIVSFEVVAGTGAAGASFGMTETLATLSALASSQRVSSSAAQRVDLTLPATSQASMSAAVSADSAAVTCSLQKLGTYGPVWAIVGETYTNPAATAAFTYTAESSSTFGIGISSGGVFTASGTSTATSTATVGFPTTPTSSARQWRTQFQYDKYTDLCGHTYARPGAFLGGSNQLTPGQILATNCVSQLAGSTFTKSSTNSSTLSVGVDSSTVIGIDLSAQTGFTTKAKVKYTFVNAGKMCGSSGFPGATPGRLAART